MPPSVSDMKTTSGKYDSFRNYLEGSENDAEVGNSNTGDRIGRNNGVHFEQRKM